MKAILGSWTTGKAALAVAGGLAIAGAIGSAVAMSPIITPPIKWQGGAEFIGSVNGDPTLVFKVPAGRNFILTDLFASNGNTVNTHSYNLGVGSDGDCVGGIAVRLLNILVPAGSTSHVPLQTGVGFASGQAVCVSTTANMDINGRGFLFTAVPPS